MLILVEEQDLDLLQGLALLAPAVLDRAGGHAIDRSLPLEFDELEIAKAVLDFVQQALGEGFQLLVAADAAAADDDCRRRAILRCTQ
ncbi:hypothetical protein Pssp01_41080 [Pseudomonas sp. NBRC 100443]|nr:hypothetical protein Pssp01_41080 [Pseudomonas sp. NBRC 100443]